MLCCHTMSQSKTTFLTGIAASLVRSQGCAEAVPAARQGWALARPAARPREYWSWCCPAVGRRGYRGGWLWARLTGASVSL